MGSAMLADERCTVILVCLILPMGLGSHAEPIAFSLMEEYTVCSGPGG